MLASVVLALFTLAPGHPSSTLAPVEPKDTFAHVQAFRSRADVHIKDVSAGAAIEAGVVGQIESTLRKHGIATTKAAPVSRTDATADLIVDVHLVEAQGRTAIAWSFHVSQMVRLATGQTAFAATWIVGDLVDAASDAVEQRLRDSLQPALDEFCEAHLASRAARPGKSPAESQDPRANERSPENSADAGARL